MGKVWILSIALLILLTATASAGSWNLVKLTDNDVDDRFSPYGMTADGSKIVFTADTDGNYATNWDREVFIMDLETKKVERITDNIYQESCAAISADGSKVAFVERVPISDEEYIRKVYVVSESKGWNQKNLITTSSGYMVCPMFSPDGKYLFLFEADWEDRIRIFDTTTGNQIGAYTSAQGICNWPVQSPDKAKFAYIERTTCAGNPDKLCQKVHVVSTSPPFSDSVIYTTTGGILVEEIWYLSAVSNDGKVAFYMEANHPGEGAKKGVFLYENGNIRFLTPTDEPAVVAISGDGSKVFYFEFLGNKRVYKINTDGSGKEMIGELDETGSIGTPVANYDGSKVVFECEEGGWGGNMEIYMLSQQTVNSNFPGINVELFPTLPPTTSVVVGSAKATHGDEVQIPVEIKNADKVGSMDIVLSYPSEVLQLLDVIPGSLTQNSLLEHNVEDGKIKVGIVDTNGISGDGSLFYMKFSVVGTPEPVNLPANIPGERLGVEKEKLYPSMPGLFRNNEYNLLIEDLAVYATDGSEIIAMKVNGTFELVSEDEAHKGDVNGDGQITSVDALLALQMAVGKLEPKPVADMDDDGKVTSKDAMEIMKIANENMLEKAQRYMQQGFKMPKTPKIGK